MIIYATFPGLHRVRCARSSDECLLPTPGFSYHRQTSKKWRENPWERVLVLARVLPMMNRTKSEPADEFNAVRWKRQNLCVLYNFLCAVEWCMIISTSFSRGKGCKHIEHDLLWIQPHTQSTVQLTSWCAIAWYFLFYLLCFLISWSICDVSGWKRAPVPHDSVFQALLVD